MNNLNRSNAAYAISVCDQIEAALQDGDEVMIQTYRQWLREWVQEAPPEQMLVIIRGIRLQAQEILNQENSRES